MIESCEGDWSHEPNSLEFPTQSEFKSLEDLIERNKNWNAFRYPEWIMQGQNGKCLVCKILTLKIFFAVVKSDKAKWGKEWKRLNIEEAE